MRGEWRRKEEEGGGGEGGRRRSHTRVVAFSFSLKPALSMPSKSAFTAMN